MPMGTALLLLRSPSLFVPVASRIFSEGSDPNLDTSPKSTDISAPKSPQSEERSDEGISSHYRGSGASYLGPSSNLNSNASGFELEPDLERLPDTAPAVTVATAEQPTEHIRQHSMEHSTEDVPQKSTQTAQQQQQQQQQQAQQQQEQEPSKPVPQQHITAFAAATIATIVGTIVAWLVVGRGAVATGAVDASCMASLAAALCASYIGGSVNFAAILQVPYQQHNIGSLVLTFWACWRQLIDQRG